MRRKDSWCVEMIWFLFILVSAPNFIHAGDLYTVNVTFNYTHPTNITFYEYVYNGTNCVSSGWTSNKKTILATNQTISILDKIRDNTPSGVYHLRVRFLINGAKYDYTKQVGIIGNEEEKAYYIFAFVGSVSGLIYIFYRFRKE